MQQDLLLFEPCISAVCNNKTGYGQEKTGYGLEKTGYRLQKQVIDITKPGYGHKKQAMNRQHGGKFSAHVEATHIAKMMQARQALRL